MKLVKVNGSIFIFTTCNNHTGHGFYQFSPETFFRIFSEENGFEIQDVILETHPFPGAELSTGKRLYSVRDPAVVKKRIGLVSKSPVIIMVHAKKISEKRVFENYPIQSDYSTRHGIHSEGDCEDLKCRLGGQNDLRVSCSLVCL
jgi:hypothetical protein